MTSVLDGIEVRQLSIDEYAALQSNSANDPAIAGLRDEVQRAFTHGSRALLLRAGHGQAGSEATFARAFQTIGSWLGTASPQSPEGETVARVESRPDDPQRRGTHSEDELQPHTDLHDILALGCVRQAATGGASFLVPAETLREHMARDHPEAMPALEQGYYLGTNPALQSRCRVSRDKVPIFIESAGKTLACWNGYFLRAAAASRDEPPPADLERALAQLRSTAARLAAASPFMLEPGDMLFWHNWTWLHGRTAFADDAARPRLLLRLWLRSALVPRPDMLSQLAERIDDDHLLTRELGYRQT